MKNRVVSAMVAFGILALISAGPSWAIPVQNASFESPFHPLSFPCGAGCSYNNGLVTNWTTTGQTGVFHPDASRFNLPLPDGFQTAYSNGGSLTQALAATLQNNTTYTLSVEIGKRLDFPTLFPGYSVALFAGSTLLGSESLQNPTAGNFATSTVSYHSLASDPSAGQLLSIKLVSAGTQTNFDKVTLNSSSAVPEPASLLLLGSGLAGLGLWRWKRRKEGTA